MAEEYSRSLCRVVAAQVAEAQGFDGLQSSACDALAELLMRYIKEIGSTASSYQTLAGRTDCNVTDFVR